MGAHAKDDLPPETIKALLNYDPRSGIFTWKKRVSATRGVGEMAGAVTHHGYLRINIKYRGYHGHRLAWVLMTGTWPTKQIDHKNCNSADNRWGNLREATGSQNQKNRRKNTNNTSGYKGVYFVKKTGKWQASLAVNGRLLHLGTYKTKKAAAEAYKQASKKHGGEFARFD